MSIANLNAEWSEAMFAQECDPNKKPNTDISTLDYIRIGNDTSKALFFVTEDDKDSIDIRGFWLPMSAILCYGKDKVTFYNWCKVTLIYYR